MACLVRRGERRCGFTLVELITAVAILGVLIGIGVPALSAMTRDARLSAFTNELHTAITLARSEAIRRGHRVTLCVSRDGLQCTADATAGWESGWVMFPDPDGNILRAVDEQLIRSRGAADAGLMARGNGTLARYISYMPSGATRSATGALQMGTVKVCGNDRQRSVVINAAGRVRVERQQACD